MMTQLNTTPASSDLISLVAQSELFLRYREAFRETTGRLLRLAATADGGSFPACPQIPVRAAERIIGFLSVDPFRIIGAENSPFNEFAHRMLEGGASPAELRAARKTYDGLPAMSGSLARAVITMLEIFSAQLGAFAEVVFLHSAANEPMSIRKARDYILDHLADGLTLEDVASHAGVSVFHFCKIFKKTTGHTFTEFVSRARIEEAKRRLMNPRMRVTEIAYDVGFQSLSQFNRSFKRLTHQSPSEYRSTHGLSLRIAA